MMKIINSKKDYRVFAAVLLLLTLIFILYFLQLAASHWYATSTLSDYINSFTLGFYLTFVIIPWAATLWAKLTLLKSKDYSLAVSVILILVYIATLLVLLFFIAEFYISKLI